MTDILIVTNKTLIIPDDAPPVLRMENVDCACHWQSTAQEGEMLYACGECEFMLNYSILCAEDYENIDYEELLEQLENESCNPQTESEKYCLALKTPIEINEQLLQDCLVNELCLSDLSYTVISPLAVEIQLEWQAICQNNSDSCCENDFEDDEEDENEDNENEECEDSENDNYYNTASPKDNITKVDASYNETARDDSDTMQTQSSDTDSQTETAKANDNAEDSIKTQTPLYRPRFSASKHNPFAQNKEERKKTNYSMKFYRVSEGENLWSIAEKMQVSASDISALNKLADGEVKAGMLLSIPK